MKQFVVLILLICSSISFAQVTDSVKTEENKTEVSKNTNTGVSKWYYGGNIGFSFWGDYFYLGVYPLVGYKVTPQLSLGAKIGYAYISDNRYDPFPALKTSNYGASVFTRYRIIPQLYAHAEFAYWSYENITSFNTVQNTYNTERFWVPYLLLGGGFSQNIGPNVWAFAEVLFDVINDENSPYKSGDPFISVGVGVGF
jgi:hypothetical protein